MPELPDIEGYIDALASRIVGARLTEADVSSPFLLRTAEPPLASVHGRRVTSIERIGKRNAIGFDGDLWLVLHLMIASRLHWHDKPPKPSRRALAMFRFETGSLSLTGTKKRALPDGRQAAGRSLAVAALEERLAADDRRPRAAAP